MTEHVILVIKKAWDSLSSCWQNGR